jgi:hypothetical protein
MHGQPVEPISRIEAHERLQVHHVAPKLARR